MSTDNLKRRLSGFDATTFVVSDMVGSGIFFTTGIIAFHIGAAPELLFAWVLGGMLALLGALSYAELAAAFPRAGGEYNYLSEAYHPLLGFLSGWTSWVIGFAAPIAIGGLVGSEFVAAYIGKEFAETNLSPIPFVTLNGKTMIGVAVIVFMVVIQIVRAGSDRITQLFLTAVKILAIGGVIAAAFASGGGSLANLSSALAPEATENGSFWVGMVIIMFSYSGWNASSYIAGEIKDPGRNLPLSLIAGTLIVTLLYFIINVVYLYALPMDKVQGTYAIAQTALGVLLGETGGSIASAVITISIFGAIYTMLFIGPRVLYAMSRDGVFFQFAGKVDPNSGVPVGSILSIAAFAIIMVLLADLRELLEAAGFVLVTFNVLAVLAVFVLRVRRPELERPYKLPTPLLVLPAIFCAFGLWMMYSSFTYKIESTMAGLLIVLLGVPGYFFFKRKE